MNMRIAQSDDWSKLRDIRLTFMKTDPQAFGGSLAEEIERQEPEWRKRLESLDRFYCVAEEEGAFVSIAGAKETSKGVWMLVSVYTRQTHRGKGLAQKLVEMVMNELKKRGISTLELMVNIDQKDALHLYEKLGFTLVKVLKEEKMADGKFHDEYFMAKKLS
jgi:ribosomal protein S18 acetylase RimI-like enzyme